MSQSQTIPRTNTPCPKTSSPENQPPIFDRLMIRLNEATEILEAAELLLKMVNGRPGKTPASATELAAALNTQIVVQVVGSQLDYLRDPEHYFEEEYHGE